MRVRKVWSEERREGIPESRDGKEGYGGIDKGREMASPRVGQGAEVRVHLGRSSPLWGHPPKLAATAAEQPGALQL